MGPDDTERPKIIDLDKERMARRPHKPYLVSSNERPSRRTILRRIAAAAGLTLLASVPVLKKLKEGGDIDFKNKFINDFNLEPGDTFRPEDMDRFSDLLRKLKPFEQLIHPSHTARKIELTDDEKISETESDRTQVNDFTSIEIRRKFLYANDSRLGEYEIIKEFAKLYINQLDDNAYGEILSKIRSSLGYIGPGSIESFSRDLSQKTAKYKKNSPASVVFDNYFIISEIERSKGAGSSFHPELAGIFGGVYSQGRGVFVRSLTQLYPTNMVERLYDLYKQKIFHNSEYPLPATKPAL